MEIYGEIKQQGLYNLQSLAMEEVVQQLMRMLETISLNAGYARYFKNEDLIDHEVYLDICQIIFPELNIKIIKIQEEDGTSDEKLQYLISLLSEELGYDLSKIQGKEIKRANLRHIHRFLDLLFTYSKIYIESGAVKLRVKTDPAKEPSGEVCRNSYTARVDPKKQGVNSTGNNSPKNMNSQDQVRQTKSKSVKQKRSSSKKKSRRQRNERNLYQSVVNIVMKQKNNMMKASMRDQRKNKHEDIILAKNKYKAYLTTYTKQSKIRKYRSSMQNQAKMADRELPIRDIENIQNFYKSFQYKFRDQKCVYLRRMNEVIRKQEQDRFCYQNRIDRQTKVEMDNLLSNQVKAVNHQHKIKYDQLKQKGYQVSKSISLMKKQCKKKANDEKRELKILQKKKLQAMQNYIHQQNQKALMNLQQGGRLQKVIMGMYKRF